MHTIFEKTKPILLLVGLTLTALSFVWIVNQFKTTDQPYTVNTQIQEQYLIQDNSSVLQESDGVQAQEVVEDTSTVLAASDSSSQSCKEALIKYKTESICARNGSGSQDYQDGSRSGNLVSKDSKVYLTEVTMPLVLMSGSKGVPDSNRMITEKTPNVYKPAGEQFDEKIANTLLPPTKQIAVKRPWAIKEAFSNFFSIAFSKLTDKPTEAGDLVVDKYLQNDCESVGNDSNITPDKSNKIASFMYDSISRTPGEKEKIKNMDISESCNEDTDKFIELDKTSYTACKLNLLGNIMVSLKATFGADRWNNCHEHLDADGNIVPPTEDCVDTENIVVIISSSFGSSEDCKDDVCTNAYLNNKVKTSLSPTDSSAYNSKTYFLTPCKAYIEGVATPINVKCAWDLDYLMKDRDLNEFDNVGSEKTPDESSYIKFLVDDTGKRDSEVALPM